MILIAVSEELGSKNFGLSDDEKYWINAPNIVLNNGERTFDAEIFSSVNVGEFQKEFRINKAVFDSAIFLDSLEDLFISIPQEFYNLSELKLFILYLKIKDTTGLLSVNKVFSRHLFENVTNFYANDVDGLLNKFSAFNSKWYNETYLQDDAYHGNALAHYITHGALGTQAFAPWILEEECKGIVREYGSIGKFYDTKYESIRLNGAIPSALQIFDCLIEICGARMKPMGFILKLPLAAIIPLDSRFKLCDMHEVISIETFLSSIHLAALNPPEWFDAHEYQFINPHVSVTNVRELYRDYVCYGLNSKKALSRHLGYAPLNLYQLKKIITEDQGSLFPSANSKKLSSNDEPYVISIVLYKNPIDELKKCLESIASNRLIKKIEVVLVKNSLTDYLIDESLYDSASLTLHVIGSGENVGFGAGHNLAFNYISQKIFKKFNLIIMNPDAALHPSALEKMTDSMREKGADSIYEFSHLPLPHPKLINPETGETPWFSGACAVIPSNIYRKLDGFDENIFLYCEDVDMSVRAMLAGIKIINVSNALVWHDDTQRNNFQRYPVMLAAAVILCKKFGKIINYLEYFRRLEELIVSNEYRLALQKNIEGCINTVPIRLPGGKLPYIYDFYDLHFAPARSFKFS